MTADLETKKRKILIVDNNTAFRDALRGLLYSRFPFLSIEEAVDGKEALENVKHAPPDIIFVANKLPGESVFDLTRKVKNSYPGTIIVIATNYDLPEYQEAARRNGASHFILKGFSTAGEISDLVESLFSGHRPTPGDKSRKKERKNEISGTPKRGYRNVGSLCLW